MHNVNFFEIQRKIFKNFILVMILLILSSGLSQAAAVLFQSGAETLTPTGAAPNPDRCGAPPQFIQLEFATNGIDTVGGMFTGVATACLDTSKNIVFDMQVTNTYTTSGNKIFVTVKKFAQIYNVDICTTSVDSTAYAVTGGTGDLQGIQGSGFFTANLNITTCNGTEQSGFLSFSGRARLKH